MKCVYCYRHIWLWQRSLNGSMHDICNEVWYKGFNCAKRIVKDPTYLTGLTCCIPSELPSVSIKKM